MMISKYNRPDVQVISAFPGLGKTWATEQLKKDGYLVSDSDSSGFPKDKFPGNYIEHIKNKIEEFSIHAEGCTHNDNKPNYIFVSSHKEVRDALRKNDIVYILFYPAIELKQMMIDRYKARGNAEGFIKLLEENYESWINEIEADTTIRYSRKLHDGRYMYDLLTK